MAPYQGRESGSFALHSSSSSSLFHHQHSDRHCPCIASPDGSGTPTVSSTSTAAAAPWVHSPTGSDSDDRSPPLISHGGGMINHQHAEFGCQVDCEKVDREFGPPPGLARIAVGSTCNKLSGQQHPQLELRLFGEQLLKCENLDTDMQCHSPSTPISYQQAFASVDDCHLDALIQETVGDGLLGDGFNLF